MPSVLGIDKTSFNLLGNDQMTTISTASDLKAAVEAAGRESHFFSRNNMKFAGDTMSNFGLRRAFILTSYNAEGDYMGPGEGVAVEVFELYRKKPVKKGNQSSFYFDMEKFTQRHGEILPYPAFRPGQLVEYTNPQGVYWGVCQIVSIEYRTKRPCYYITPTDTPWFAVGEECFELVNPNKPRSSYKTWGKTFKTHAFEDDATANAFMIANPGWGLLGIEEDHSRKWRHVARMDDKGE